MATFTKIFTVGVLFLVLGTGCTSKKAKSNDAATAAEDPMIPPPDAGTDAVPSAAVEDRSGEPSANAQPPVGDSADLPPPPAENGLPPPPAEGAADLPPPTAPAPIADTAPPAPPVENPVVAPVASNDTPPPAEAASEPTHESSSEQGSYTVHAGDTLMKIAFETYGDLYKWKDIYEANKDHISNPNALSAGTVLKLDAPSTPVTVAKNGNPYLIKDGDTLGTISTDVYGTKTKWKKIWKNNKQLIHDPNKIYAGFYLYYKLTPAEREDFIKRKGSEPDQVSPAPMAEKPTETPAERSTAAVPPQPQAVAQPPANPAVQPVQTAETQGQAPPQSENVVATPPQQRDPASVVPPKVEQKAVAPISAPPAVPQAVPPPSAHSADLNEVMEKASKDDAKADNGNVLTTAGP